MPLRALKNAIGDIWDNHFKAPRIFWNHEDIYVTFFKRKKNKCAGLAYK